MIEITIKTGDDAVAKKLLQFIKQIGLEIQQVESPSPLTQVNIAADITSSEMNDQKFWHIISLLEWNKIGDDEAVIAAAISALSEYSKTAILSFYDLLSEKLYLLDGKSFAHASVVDEEIFSADLFLYARCAVVANGQEAFTEILREPSLFPEDLYFEALLQLPKRAWLRKTGEALKYVPKFIYETGYNPNGWGEQTITL